MIPSYFFPFVFSFITVVTAQCYHGITYEIVSGNNEDCFEINPYSGVVTLAKELDYEKVERYQLKISAMSTEDMYVTTDVIINVHDVNDNRYVAKLTKVKFQ